MTDEELNGIANEGWDIIVNWKNEMETIKKQKALKRKMEEHIQKEKEEQAKKICLMIEKVCKDFVKSLGRKWKFYKTYKEHRYTVVTPTQKASWGRYHCRLIIAVSPSSGIVHMRRESSIQFPSDDYSDPWNHIRFDVFTEDFLTNELRKFLYSGVDPTR